MKLNVLLIEDDDEDYAFIEDMVAEIRDVEVTLIHERDYKNGLSALIEHDVQVCVVDFQIGETSGVEFVRKLKKIGCDLPMIILTGSGDHCIDRAALEAGAANYLDKNGLSAERLSRALRYAAVQPQESKRDDSKENGTPLPLLQPLAVTPTVGAGTHHTDKMRVLLIDDDEDDYLLTKELLAEVFGRHLKLDWINNWQQALEAVFEARHDIVIVDYRLGERNGLELVREAVQLGCLVPFIVLTGEGNREIDLEAMHAGATDYLVKGEINSPLLDRSIRYAIERHRAERRLAEIAQIDQLTGLANRYRFRDFLDRTIARADRNRQSVALMLIDLNRFKAVNDTYGHAAGDLLLQEIAGRLRRSVRPGDMVARLGGDEFTIVMTEIPDNELLSSTSRRILHELGQPVDIGICEVLVGASIGIALYPRDASSADGLIVSADTAMYAGKGQQAASFHFYTAEMHQMASCRLEMEKRLRLAVEYQQFQLFFQPQVSLQSGRLIGFEALLRWNHPELGMIVPDDFIELAEESGLILPIGEWVLEATCAQLADWRKSDLPDVHIAVNFSARQFQEDGLVDLVAETLDRYDIPANLLEIEITESDILQEPKEAYALLNRFSNLGIRVALDDFGTGYSSLNHLRAFPGAIIKIDRSFICDIDSAVSHRAIVQSLIAMAHDLDLKVVAEGVESLNQLRYLKSRNCDIVQGYLISRPLPATAISSEIFQTNFMSRFVDTKALVS
ncbi:MAG: EAL domain-containing protein [Geminicoccaceae bacterium]